MTSPSRLWSNQEPSGHDVRDTFHTCYFGAKPASIFSFLLCWESQGCFLLNGGHHWAYPLGFFVSKTGFFSALTFLLSPKMNISPLHIKNNHREIDIMKQKVTKSSHRGTWSSSVQNLTQQIEAPMGSCSPFMFSWESEVSMDNHVPPLISKGMPDLVEFSLRNVFS